MTNADRIRQMNNEELLDLVITLIQNAVGFHVPSEFRNINFEDDKEIHRQWLESEYKEEYRW